MSETINVAPNAPKKTWFGGRFFTGCFSGCLISFILIFVLPIILICAVTSKVEKKLFSVTKSADGLMNVAKVKQPISYSWCWGDGSDKDPKVAKLYLNGVIQEPEEEKMSFFVMREKRAEHPLVTKIRAVTENPAFDGIWLEVDTPGGGVALSDQIYHMLCKFRDSSKGRFVFVYFKSQACSGGYYISVAADKIMAGPAAWTGSIGVIVSSYNLSKLADTLGVKSLNIVSSENKALLDPLKPVDTNHLAIIQRVVDQTYDNFLTLVSERRNIPKKLLRPIADGRILSAKDALEYKLIDAIGYEEDAMAEVLKLTTIRNPKAKAMRVYTVEIGEGLLGFPLKFELGENTVISSFLKKIFLPEMINDSSLLEYRR
jgi:signal peptide peptidase SppA